MINNKVNKSLIIESSVQMNDFMDYIKALSKFNGEMFDTWIITKITFESRMSSQVIKQEAIIEKQNQKFATLSSIGYDTNNNIVGKLKLILIKAATKIQKTICNNSNAEKWKKFSKEEIVEYLDKVKDTNTIHRGKNPIVPALYILSELNEGKHLNHTWETKFLSPIYAEEQIYLCKSVNDKNHRIITAFVNQCIVFKVVQGNGSS